VDRRSTVVRTFIIVLAIAAAAALILGLIGHFQSQHSWRLALERFEMGEAPELLLERLSRGPQGHPLIQLLRARLLYQMGKPQEALAVLDPITPEAQNYPGILYLKGLALEQSGQIQEAAGAYQQLLQLQPDFPAAIIHTARLDIARGRMASAREVLTDLINTPGASPDALALLGEISWRQGTLNEARMLLEEAARLQPQDARTSVRLAQVLLDQKNPSASLAILNKALLMVPDDLDGLKTKIIALTLIGRADEAQQTVRLARIAYPDDPELPVLISNTQATMTSEAPSSRRPRR